MCMIQTGEYRCLEIFMKSAEGKTGKLRIRKHNGTWTEYPAGIKQFRLSRIPVERAAQYEVELMQCQVSVAYLSESERMMETGICFLNYSNGDWIKVDNL